MASCKDHSGSVLAFAAKVSKVKKKKLKYVSDIERRPSFNHIIACLINDYSRVQTAKFEKVIRKSCYTKTEKCVFRKVISKQLNRLKIENIFVKILSEAPNTPCTVSQLLI